MLGGRLLLHGVDAERLAGSVVARYLRGSQATLSPADAEDLLAFLVASAWEIAERYQPELDRRPNFSAYCGRILDRRIAVLRAKVPREGREAVTCESPGGPRSRS
jgi:DNA-directed RNA polymerase specialized sigma24 family protein